MDIREVLAQNLRRYRREKGFSQEELAHRAGIDRTYVSSLERRVYAAGIDVLDRLAVALGIQAADLLMPPEMERKGLPQRQLRCRPPKSRGGLRR